jgi:hypothetical protein
MRANFFLSLVAATGALALSKVTLAERVPDTPTKPVTNEYRGVTVEARVAGPLSQAGENPCAIGARFGLTNKFGLLRKKVRPNIDGTIGALEIAG